MIKIQFGDTKFNTCLMIFFININCKRRNRCITIVGVLVAPITVVLRNPYDANASYYNIDLACNCANSPADFLYSCSLYTIYNVLASDKILFDGT